MKDAVMEDEDGQVITSSSARFKEIAKGPNRELRKKAYQADKANLASYNNTLASIYASHVKNNVVYSEARNYESTLQRSLEEDHIPKSIYDNLMSITQNNLDSLQSYFALYKQKLGYEEIYPYDLVVPLADNQVNKIPYDKAVEIVREALRPLGEEYIKKFDEATENRWIDAYPDENKYTGAYSATNIYDVHPYILLNYNGSVYWASALAHEIGHAVNQDFSAETQAYMNADVNVFTTEVAASVNELLLMDYLIENTKNDQEKMILLDTHLKNLMNCFFGQVQYSLFEQKAHEMAESGQPLTPQALNNLWHSIMEGFGGGMVNTEDFQGVGWSNVPHLYSSFYVYKYATSISAAYSLAEKIREGGDEAIDSYIDFLKSGSSDYPVELLKKAGVDMSSPEPINNFIAYFQKLVDEMDNLIQKSKSNVKDEANTAKITYIVKPGDVLWKIARNYGMTLEELTELNNLVNPDIIFAGNKLVVER